MTEKQKLFADEYLKDLNQRRAYKAVYKNVKNDGVADVCACKLMKKKEIRDYIDKRLEEIHDENTADIKEVMEYLTSVMRGDSSSSVIALVGEGVQGIVNKPPDEKERLKAAELLGKRYGMFTEKVQAEVVTPIFEGEDMLED